MKERRKEGGSEKKRRTEGRQAGRKRERTRKIKGRKKEKAGRRTERGNGGEKELCGERCWTEALVEENSQSRGTNTLTSLSCSPVSSRYLP